MRMPVPSRILLRPASMISCFRPDFILQVLRYRWRFVAAVMTLTVGFVLWSVFTPYSASTIIYVQGLGPEGVVTNADCGPLSARDGF